MEKPHQQKREDKKRLAKNKREAKKQKLKTTNSKTIRFSKNNELKTAKQHFKKIKNKNNNNQNNKKQRQQTKQEATTDMNKIIKII